jgi:hypothetical protein
MTYIVPFKVIISTAGRSPATKKLRLMTFCGRKVVKILTRVIHNIACTGSELVIIPTVVFR